MQEWFLIHRLPILSVEKYGEMTIKTADALEAYGNALLKNAIAHSAVLGGEAAKEQGATANSTSAFKRLLVSGL